MRLCPRQLFGRMARLEKVRQGNEATMELMLGQLIAMVANTGFARFKKPREAREFMPSLLKHRMAKAKPKRSTRKEQLRKAADIRAAFNTFFGPETDGN